MIRLQAESFNPGTELNLFMQGRTDKGAVVSFTGHVRDYASDETVSVLELEHYPGYTESEIAKIRNEAASRWPGTESLVIHRYGPLQPGDPIVFVAVASAHRKAAFEAATFLMDYLKTQAPFWKKEIRGDKAVWIEPKDSDYTAQESWEDHAGN